MPVPSSCAFRPALVIIARYEPAFRSLAMRQTLEKRPRVQCKMYDARHGSRDADCATFDAAYSSGTDDAAHLFRDITRSKHIARFSALRRLFQRAVPVSKACISAASRP